MTDERAGNVRFGERLIGAEMVPFCLDCGVLVGDAAAHERFHSILGGHAWALAVLKTAHIAAHIHDRYDVAEKIDSKRFDNWSADALAEVLKEAEANVEN